MALLEIENLSVEFPSATGMVRAVDGVSFALAKGELLGVVGESGSGKSLTLLAAMGLVPDPGRVTADRLTFKGRDLLTLSDRERRQLPGKSVAMIFQEPTTSLNPCFTVGFQLVEGLRVHEQRMAHIDMRLAEITDKLDGLIGFMGGYFKRTQ